jgi:hypothetical protein
MVVKLGNVVMPMIALCRELTEMRITRLKEKSW